jgi:phosphoribosylanthranilate isomerase
VTLPVTSKVKVKLCGVTSVADAELCVDAGADAIGLNFHPRSPRSVSVTAAREIAERVKGRALIVGVFVDADFERITEVTREVGLECVQLHGDEPPELLARLLPHVYKAIRVRDQSSIEDAARFGGEHLLLDAYVPGEPGGTGKTFAWELARDLARTRRVTLAGGLVPGNVAAAIAAVRPYAVDVASGIERAPGVKDEALVRAFVTAAKSAR